MSEAKDEKKGIGELTINKAADSSAVFLGLKDEFRWALFILIGIFAVLWMVFNSLELPWMIQFLVPIGLLASSILALRYVAQKLGRTGLNKLFMKKGPRIIYHDRANPYKDL